jgi:hypothetical protein
MRQIVIMPGGFHPFHAGHAALYKSAIGAFNNADTYVAATNDTKTRPFPFAIKEKLARLAGVADKHFVQVKSPFQPIEITGHYNPKEDVLIFVRSEKDRNESPKPGGTKKDGTPAYFQPWTGKDVQPFGQHAYMAYLPTVEFGPGITSATEIRNAWPTLNDKRRTAMVMSLYPVTQKNPKLAANVVKMLDMGMGNELTEETEVPQSVRVLQALKNSLESYLQNGGARGGQNLKQELIPLLNHLNREGDGELARSIMQMIRDSEVDDRRTKGMSWAVFAQALVKKLPELITSRVKQGMTEGKRKKKSKNRSLGRYFFPGYSYYGGSGESGEGGGDGGGEGMNEFAPLGSADREPNEEEILRQLAAQWWNGTEQQMKKAQQTLQSMGWEIGQDESGDDDAGVFVIRIGDEHGDSYIAFNHSDLSLDENMGLPYPATYEEENQIRKNGPMRITAMTSESNLSESLDYLEEK